MKSTRAVFQGLLLLSLLGSFTPSLALAGDVMIGGHPAAGDHFLLSFTQAVDAGEIAERLAAMGFHPLHVADKFGRTSDIDSVRLLKSLGNATAIRFISVAVPPSVAITDAIKAASRLPGVIAEPDWRRDLLTFQPNDPYYDLYQSNFQQIRLPEAWDLTLGEGVIVAVIDSGYHKGMDDSAHIVSAWDFWGDDENVEDYIGHGTLVANVIGEATNNGIGCASVAPSSKIMPLKVFPDGEGGAYDEHIAQAIDFAAANGAKVVNMSLGGGEYSHTSASACRDAWEAGVIVLAASGNSSGDVEYPAGYDDVIAVGSSVSHSVGDAPKRSDFSNYGEKLDLVAPGESITQQGWSYGAEGYYGASGTSLAVPHAAGLAALLMALAPDDGRSPDDIAQIMFDTAWSDLEDWDETVGWGEIDAGQAVKSLAQTIPNEAPVASIIASATSGPAPLAVNFSGLGSSDPDGSIKTYSWSLPDMSVRNGAQLDYVFQEEGTYQVRLTVTDQLGLGGAAVTTIDVQAGASSDDGGDSKGGGCSVATHNPDEPGFGVIAFFLAASVFIIRKRKRNHRL